MPLVLHVDQTRAYQKSQFNGWHVMIVVVRDFSQSTELVTPIATRLSGVLVSCPGSAVEVPGSTLGAATTDSDASAAGDF